MDKYSKVIDGTSFKAKFYKILDDQVHKEGSFRRASTSHQIRSQNNEAVFVNDGSKFHGNRASHDTNQSFMPTQKQDKIKSPMVNFKVLSNTFDEESTLGPNRTGQLKGLYKRFESQQKVMVKLGVDMTKKEHIESELSDLLHTTRDMNSIKAHQHYDRFVKETESRIDGVIYRLQHHYNLGKKINSINMQSKKTHSSFSEERKGRGLKPVELKGDTKPGSHVLGAYLAQIEGNI